MLSAHRNPLPPSCLLPASTEEEAQKTFGQEIKHSSRTYLLPPHMEKGIFCAWGVHSSRKTEPGVINPVPYVPFTPKRATVPVSPKLHPPRCRSLVVPVLPSTGAG